VSSGKCSLCET